MMICFDDFDDLPEVQREWTEEQRYGNVRRVLIGFDENECVEKNK